MAVPPVVQWMRYDFDESEFQEIPTSNYKWDAGIVEAGSSSVVDENCLFYVWNNYPGSVTDTNQSPDYDRVCATMKNVRISVKDAQGTDVDKKVCGSPGDPAKQATVSVQYWNANQVATASGWGYYDTSTPPQWIGGENRWVDLTSANPVIISQASGATQVATTGGWLSGAKITSANPTVDDTVGSAGPNSNNYIKLRLMITADGNADAGTVEWINRISYQYDE